MPKWSQKRFSHQPDLVGCLIAVRPPLLSLKHPPPPLANKKESPTEEEPSAESLQPLAEFIKHCRQEIPLGIGRRVIIEMPEDIATEELAKVIRVLKALSET